MSEISNRDDALLRHDLERIGLQILAYDDPAGVTRRVNLNLLAHINRSWVRILILICFPALGALELSPSGVSICICVSTRRQTVHIPAASLRVMLDEDEPSDRKFAQVPGRENSRDGGAHRFRVAGTVDRFGVGPRTEPYDCRVRIL